MKRKSDLYLKDILGSIKRIDQSLDSVNYEEFSKDHVKTDAVLRNLEVIGEAAHQIPLETKKKYHDVPWREIQDFRIVVAHHYWKINLERVWDIVENKLPSLKQQVKEILKKETK